MRGIDWLLGNSPITVELCDCTSAVLAKGRAAYAPYVNDVSRMLLMSMCIGCVNGSGYTLGYNLHRPGTTLSSTG